MSEYLTGQCADTIGYSMYTGKSQHGEAARNAFSLHQLLLIFQLRDPSLVYKRLTGYQLRSIMLSFHHRFCQHSASSSQEEEAIQIDLSPSLAVHLIQQQSDHPDTLPLNLFGSSV